MDSVQPPVITTQPTVARQRLAVFLKVASILLLLVLLHIPLVMTQGVLRERQAYQMQATEEIAGLWGRAQQVNGPVLAVPYAFKQRVIRPTVVQGRVEQVETTELVTAVAYFLPEQLSVDGAVEPEVRRRGIHEAVVFAAELKLVGNFRPDFTAAGIAAERVDWAKAEVLFGVSDLRGIRALTAVRTGGEQAATFESADGGPAFLPLAAKVTNLAAGESLDFAFEVSLQGSDGVRVVPAGKVTQVRLQSPWADPSFGGAYLPAQREVGENGFVASWEIAHFSRGFAQSWTSCTDIDEVRGKMEAAGFGVTFAHLVDGYRMVERAQKYGVLFFVLVFAVFFLFEVTARLRIHPLQYAMVGVALCLFFLGFLALSEFVATGIAYGVAAAVCTVLVSLYAWSFLRTGGRTLVIGGGLGATYAYLYFVLQSQDYALLAGTAALFAALALVMWGTRRINWYSLEMNAEGPAEKAEGLKAEG